MFCIKEYTMLKVNDLVDLTVFSIDASGKTSLLPHALTKDIKAVLDTHKVFPNYLNIQNIHYYNNKRGFVVSLSDRKRFFVRPIIKKDVNLIYLGRRLIGQPHCCAKAHAINSNLPGAYNDPEKFKTLESMNLIPCRECFEKSEHEYLMEVKSNQHPLMMHVATENVNMVFAAALIYLIGGDTNEILNHEDMATINETFFIKSIESTVRGLQNVSSEGQTILDKAQSVTDPIDVSVLQLIENTVTSAMRIANDVSLREVDKMTLNDCYELAEVMAQLRSNLNNLTFAIKYKGAVNGEF